MDRKGGAARARNTGSERALGDILLFVDADVEVYPDSLSIVARSFKENPGISALFGTYDDRPGRPNFLSQYKNLFHHFIHQTSNQEASTFWSGCGAIRKDVFHAAGKFNEGYTAASVEDIELGSRLKAQGHRILLQKDLRVKHNKGYSFASLIKSDFFDRAIPWTVLMLSNKELVLDLNLKAAHRWSAVLMALWPLLLVFSLVSPWFLLPVPLVFVLYFGLNLEFYRFFLNKRGFLFTLRTIPFHMLYYYYSMLGFAVGTCKYISMKAKLSTE
jgi:GT2 family glycosyltransferase